MQETKTKSVCPLCGQENQCAMATGYKPGGDLPVCWCASVEIPLAVLQQIPPGVTNAACICRSCVGTRDSAG